MKKIIFSLALALGLGLSGFSQEGGLFGYGPEREYDYDYYSTNRNTGLLLPTSHGLDDDFDSPLGTGTAILLGLGAAYFVSKRNRKK